MNVIERVLEIDGRSWWRVAKDWLDVPYQLRRLKWAYQRVERGYSDKDLWNFGDFVVDVLARGLDDFRRRERRGVPACVFEYDESGNIKDEEAGHRRWEEILCQMSRGFAAADHLSADCDCPFIPGTLQVKKDFDFQKHREDYLPAWTRAFDLASEFLLGVWD